MDSLISNLRGLWIPNSALADRYRLIICQLDGSRRLLFSFASASDLHWVVTRAPWSYEKALFAVAVTDGTVDPLRVSLQKQFFWIRIRGIPPLYIDEETGLGIGEAVGDYIKTGKDRNGSFLGRLLWVRVGVDVEKPLRKGISIPGASWSGNKLFKLEYERLPQICLYCGVVSHTGFSCPRRLSGEIPEPTYDVLLNAERKEAWLAKREMEEAERETVSGGGSTRVGMHPVKHSGWAMAYGSAGFSYYQDDQIETRMG
ncbi:uncharacterized protein At4g02000-like [Rosa chinensis]|uniref:uncharacterized protein At4g02000-like n=1 Tax=Rosa chinensis TaxID=74649 RepID=UPI000D08BF18|nr:uncharacterized protein At4g02000-like [Rosa chinensis]